MVRFGIRQFAVHWRNCRALLWGAFIRAIPPTRRLSFLGTRIAGDRPGTNIVFPRFLARHFPALRRRGISINRSHVSRQMASTEGARAVQQCVTLIPSTAPGGRKATIARFAL